MIKNKFNFTIGIICLVCFISAIVHHRDTFVLMFSAFAAAGNILIGLTGKNDD